MKGHEDLPALLMLLGVSVVGPVVAVRLKLPTPVILMLAGIALGPAGTGLLQDLPTVAFLSEFGFLLLMFMAGMEIDFDGLRAAGPRALATPLLLVAGVFAGAIAIGSLAHLGIIEILAISAMSVGMPLAVLKETRHDVNALGKHVLLTASIGEFAAILAVTGLEVAKTPGTRWNAAVAVAKVTALFVGSALLIRWARALVWWYPEPFRRLIAHKDVAEMGVRVGLVVMLAFVAIAAVAGVEPILGAFIGGALIGFVLRQKHALEDKLAALGNGLFIPIFFVVVGVRFEASSLDRHAIQTAGLMALFLGATRLVPSLVFAPKGMPMRRRAAAGSLLSAPLTLVVAIGAIGGELGLLSKPKQATLVLVAMLVSVIFPTLFRVAAGPAEEPASAD
ncbi:MAG: cation:proton antiporter [Polyangiaceae bacterium]